MAPFPPFLCSPAPAGSPGLSQLMLPLVLPNPGSPAPESTVAFLGGGCALSLEDSLTGPLFPQLLTQTAPIDCFEHLSSQLLPSLSVLFLSPRWQEPRQEAAPGLKSEKVPVGGGEELIFLDLKFCLFHLAQPWSSAEHLLHRPSSSFSFMLTSRSSGSEGHTPLWNRLLLL